MKKVGVIGAGSFGIAVSNLITSNAEIIIYARDPSVIKEINEKKSARGRKIEGHVQVTGSLEDLANSCQVIFLVVPSAAFREIMVDLAPHLQPYHILIHGTKGLELDLPEGTGLDDIESLSRSHIKTMSMIITQHSVAVRVGCLAGPNLAKELELKQPAATVVASEFDEVISEGQRLLRNDRFQVYGSNDLVGIELAGVLKNIIAIAAGILSGLGYGENARGLLISRGMIEMIHLGKYLGGDVKAFLGLAGIGDLVATCNSTTSRNFTVGKRLAAGEKLNDIIDTMEEVAEGVRTVKIVKKFMSHYRIKAPITEAVFRVLFEELSPDEALSNLMKYPFSVDINFL